MAAATPGGKVNLVAAVTKDLLNKGCAGKLVRAVCYNRWWRWRPADLPCGGKDRPAWMRPSNRPSGC